MPVVALPLSHIFNRSILSGVVPKELKIARVTPVFKKGGNLTDVNYYRPISLISSFSKILEKIVCNQLKDYLVTNNILDEFQFGFQNSNSTHHPMIHLLNKVSKAMNDKEYTIALFFDLKKAFDMVPRNTLIRKLEKNGIRNNALQWFNSYLSERYQYVNVGDTNSTLQPKHVWCSTRFSTWTYPVSNILQ